MTPSPPYDGGTSPYEWGRVSALPFQAAGSNLGGAHDPFAPV